MTVLSLCETAFLPSPPKARSLPPSPRECPSECRIEGTSTHFPLRSFIAPAFFLILTFSSSFWILRSSSLVCRTHFFSVQKKQECADQKHSANDVPDGDGQLIGQEEIFPVQRLQLICTDPVFCHSHFYETRVLRRKNSCRNIIHIGNTVFEASDHKGENGEITGQNLSRYFLRQPRCRRRNYREFPKPVHS